MPDEQAKKRTRGKLFDLISGLKGIAQMVDANILTPEAAAEAAMTLSANAFAEREDRDQT